MAHVPTSAASSITAAAKLDHDRLGRTEADPDRERRLEAYSASNEPYPGRNAPEMLDETGIKNTIADFASAAQRADRIGFDVIEIHGAHGYLIHNFLSPFANRRNDGYGGSLQGRMRFAIEVFEAIRKVWPERKALGMRISATDWAEGGWTLDDSVVLATELKKRGCDYITASSGSMQQRLQGRARISGAVRGAHPP